MLSIEHRSPPFRFYTGRQIVYSRCTALSKLDILGEFEAFVSFYFYEADAEILSELAVGGAVTEHEGMSEVGGVAREEVFETADCGLAAIAPFVGPVRADHLEFKMNAVRFEAVPHSFHHCVKNFLRMLGCTEECLVGHEDEPVALLGKFLQALNSPVHELHLVGARERKSLARVNAFWSLWLPNYRSVSVNERIFLHVRMLYPAQRLSKSTAVIDVLFQSLYH